MLDIAELVQKIPQTTEKRLKDAMIKGYKKYLQETSWDSWKRDKKNQRAQKT